MKIKNEKGFTIVEILITFILVIILTVSMYSSVAAYKNKQQLESYREKIITYKNLLTKEIQDDLIMNELVQAQTSKSGNFFYVTMTFRNGTTKQLVVKRQLANETQDDSFMISYGGIDYPIPTFGSSKNEYNRKEEDFRINNIDINTNNQLLTIYIGFYHPNFSTRYAIDIVCPINFA